MRIVLAIVSAGLASAAYAGSTTVVANAGAVAGLNTSSPSTGGWAGLTGSAQTATNTYQYTLQAGDKTASGSPTELKFSPDSINTGAPHNLTGVQQTVSDGGQTASISVTGQSQVAKSTTNSSLTYYQSSWITTTQSSGGAMVSSGTYDPWTVRWNDLHNQRGLNLNEGNTATLYYQTSLVSNGFFTSGFELGGGDKGHYDFLASLSEGGMTKNFFSISVDSVTGAIGKFNEYQNFQVYLLGGNSQNRNANPGDRRSSGTLITSTMALQQVIDEHYLGNGTFDQNLDFGIYYQNFVMPKDMGNQVILTWNTDTVGRVQSTPEPATMTFTGLAAVATLRRVRRGRSKK